MDSDWLVVVNTKHTRTQSILDEFNFSYTHAAKDLATNIFTNIRDRGAFKDLFANNFPNIVAAVVLYISGMRHKTAPILEDLMELSMVKNRLAFERKIEAIENYIDRNKLDELKQSLVTTGSEHEKSLITEIVRSYMDLLGDSVKIKAENARQKASASSRYNNMIMRFVDTTICLLSDVEPIFCGKASSVIGESAVLYIGNECLFNRPCETVPTTFTSLSTWISKGGSVSTKFVSSLTDLRRWLNSNIADASTVIRDNTPIFNMATTETHEYHGVPEHTGVHSGVHEHSGVPEHTGVPELPDQHEHTGVHCEQHQLARSPCAEVEECLVILPPATP